MQFTPTKHSSNEYTYAPDTLNANNHFKAYACCGYEISDEAHSGGTASCLNGTICAYCKVDYGLKRGHVYDNDCDSACSVCGKLTRDLTFHIDEYGNDICDLCGTELEKEPMSGGTISAIAVTSTMIAGTGGFSLFWFTFKKKNWASLLKFFICLIP